LTIVSKLEDKDKEFKAKEKATKEQIEHLNVLFFLLFDVVYSLKMYAYRKSW